MNKYTVITILSIAFCILLLLMGCQRMDEDINDNYFGVTTPEGWVQTQNVYESDFEHFAQQYAHNEFPINTFTDIPQNVFDFVIHYFNTLGISLEIAETHYVRRLGVYEEYVDFFLDLQKNSYPTIRYFSIEHASKINDNLFVFTVYFEEGGNIGPATSSIRTHTFVGIINDEMFIMPSVGGVPEELSHGLDREKYRASRLDPNVLDFGDTEIFELDFNN
jgi:hypothetical protein